MLTAKSQLQYGETKKIGNNYVSVTFSCIDLDADIYPFYDEKTSPYTFWNCELFVGKNLKQHRQWRKGKKNEQLQSNGVEGLAPLRFAKKRILEFRTEWMDESDVLLVFGQDKRRTSAYRYLTRYRNILFYENGHESGYLVFHPSLTEEECINIQLMMECPKEYFLLKKKKSL